MINIGTIWTKLIFLLVCFLAFFVFWLLVTDLVRLDLDKYTQLQKKRECFKIGIVYRKWLKLSPKCPRWDENAPELYLLKNYECLLTLGCCINTSSKMEIWSCLSDFLKMYVKLQSYGKLSSQTVENHWFCCSIFVYQFRFRFGMMFCNYQASLSISKLTGFTEHLEINVTPTKWPT